MNMWKSNSYAILIDYVLGDKINKHYGSPCDRKVGLTRGYMQSPASHSHCSCSATAMASVNLTSLPPHEHQASGSSLTPKSVASLRCSYIKQFKELHELLYLDAISKEDFKRQKEKILAMMDSLLYILQSICCVQYT